MRLYKRCACANRKACRHPFWYAFKLHQHKHRGSTRTANRNLAERIAARQRNDVLEGRAGLKRTPPVRLSEHIKAYVAHGQNEPLELQGCRGAAGAHGVCRRPSHHRNLTLPHRAVEARARRRRESVDRQSRVQHHPRVFSRAVKWDRLSLSPMRRIKAYRVDDTPLRVCTPAEIKTLPEGTPEPAKRRRKPRKGAVALADLRLLARLTLEKPAAAL